MAGANPNTDTRVTVVVPVPSTLGSISPGEGRLGVFDAVSIIVGIVIGTMIFRAPSDIFKNSNDPWMGLAVWAVCGVLALIGALCYAELATNYPRSGGDYYYLTRAYGPWMGFLFGWSRLAVIFTANIGIMAIVFGENATEILDFNQIVGLPEIDGRIGNIGLTSVSAYAFTAIIVLALLNMIGVTLGKWMQNVLSVTKIAGLVAIVAAGLWLQRSPPTEWQFAAGPNSLGWSPYAMILVLYAYGGWNDAAYTAAEVRHPERNIPRALIYGVALIMIVYLVVNAAYLLGLGFEGCQEGNIPARLLSQAFGGRNGRFDVGKMMNVAIMISALGALNGLIFTGGRCDASVGNDYALLSWMGHWKPGKRSPILGLMVQMVISLAMLFLFATMQGQRWINDLVSLTGQTPPPTVPDCAGAVGLAASPFGQGPVLAISTWNGNHQWSPADAFDTMISHTAPVFWFFFLLTAVSLFVLRYRDAGTARKFSVPLYPILPLIFCATCAFMLYQSIDYVKLKALIAVGVALLGIPLYGLACLFGGYRGDAVKRTSRPHAD